MKLSRQLLVIHSLIIGLLVLGYSWLSLLNLRELSVQELQNQSQNAAQYLVEPITPAFLQNDMAFIQVKIDTFYDSGHYASIKLLTGENDKTLVYKRDDLAAAANIPAWFSYMVPFEPIVGQQEIFNELERVGLLEVQAHPHSFYQFVWRQFIDILSVTLFVGFIAWALGMALINIVLHPIVAVKRQAAAVAHKHYPQIKTRSGIAEFEQLIDVHNEMTHQIKVLFAQQQKRMDQLKHELYHNNASGLPNRTYFNLTLKDMLESHQEKTSGGLILIHLADMAQLRQQEGFATYLAVLEFVIQTTERITGMGKNCPLFQLNDQDLALLLLHQGTTDIVEYCKNLVRQLQDCTPLQQHGGSYLGVTEIAKDDDVPELMKRADEALKHAIAHDKRFYMDNVHGVHDPNARIKHKGDLLKVIKDSRLEFFLQPVVDLDRGGNIFTELYTKLNYEDEEMSLAVLLSLAEKFELTGELDKKVLIELNKHHLLGAIRGKISVNVSAFSFHSTDFQNWLFELLDQSPGLANELIMEFDEIDLSHCPQARDASYKLAKFGVQVAIDHFGRGSSSLSRFSDMKLHYLKIDSRYIHDESSISNRDYLTMVCDLVEKLGVKAIIPNIETDKQLELARNVKASGVQGYLIEKPVSIYDQI